MKMMMKMTLTHWN